MPKNVRLLGIDTTTQVEAGASRVKAGNSDEEIAEVGGVTLGDGEFVYVGGDSRPIALMVNEGKYPQIGKWYHADEWLTTQAPATFILDDGAGRLRQFGRMAIYKDILGQNSSQLWRAFRTAIQSVQSSIDEVRRLEVMVVGSFAGGTGSGMFIDTALILRMLAQQLNIHHVLRGLFALPHVFTGSPDSEMMTRSFAAWRELNRFMVIDPEFPMPLIEYVENNTNFRIRPEQRLFDACYLVDGRRAGMPLAEEAKFGVFPMMAEAISAILDEEAGTAYTQWVFTNLAPEYATTPETPMYSAMGAYTVQVPAHFVQEASGHEFAKDILLKLLSPRREPDSEGRLVAAEANRHLALAAPDRNMEDQGFAGRSRCLRLLRETAAYEGKTTKPTRFHSRIAELIELAVDASQEGQVVERLARTGGAAVDAAAITDSWVSYFPHLGDAQQFEAVQREVMEQMNYSVIQAYRRREDEKEEDARARFRKIPDDLRERFGGVTSSEIEIGQFYGECGEALSACRDVQLQLFRQLIQLTLQQILNGKPDSDPIRARSGKLGYAWDYFDGLGDELGRFLALMEKVQHRREELKPELQLAALEERAKKYLDITSGKRFLFWESPKVKRAEQAFLQAEQRMMEARREDILHHYVVETARRMKNICDQTQEAIKGWIWHLSTGDDAAQVPGLWDGVREELRQLHNAHSFDTTTPKVQKLVADQIVEANEEDLAEALSQWTWSARFEGVPPRLQVDATIEPAATERPPAVLRDPTLGESPALRDEIGSSNQSRLLGLVSRRFAGVVSRTTIADEVKRTYPDPESFADQIAFVSGEPLFDGVPDAHPRKQSSLIRVMAESTDDYFGGPEGLEGILRHKNNLNREIRNDDFMIQLVGSENPFKLTIVRSDDLFEYDHFSSWVECERAYSQDIDSEGQTLDPVLLHNFAAEARAVEYERRLLESGEAYHALHPRVVMLLEDPGAMKQFAYLGMFGMISEEESGKAYRWQLAWPRRRGVEEIWLTKGWEEDRDTSRKKPDIFNAMHGYVIMKVTQKPRRRDRIDHEFAQRIIDKKLEEMGVEGEIELLRDNLDGGIVKWLEDMAYDPDVPDRVTHYEYHDLATIIRMMLVDRLEELENKRDVGPQSSGRGSSPFSVYQPEEETVEVEEEEMGPEEGAEETQSTTPFKTA
jgi:hypothetical protein